MNETNAPIECEPDCRFEITRTLDGIILGFLEGSKDGLVRFAIRMLKNRNNIVVDAGNVTIVDDYLDNSERRCWAIHVEHEGEHYESIIRNLKYNTGAEDWSCCSAEAGG
jgi:hypothetical protein